MKIGMLPKHLSLCLSIPTLVSNSFHSQNSEIIFFITCLCRFVTSMDICSSNSFLSKSCLFTRLIVQCPLHPEILPEEIRFSGAIAFCFFTPSSICRVAHCSQNKKSRCWWFSFWQFQTCCNYLRWIVWASFTPDRSKIFPFQIQHEGCLAHLLFHLLHRLLLAISRKNFLAQTFFQDTGSCSFSWGSNKLLSYQWDSIRSNVCKTLSLLQLASSNRIIQNGICDITDVPEK